MQTLGNITLLELLSKISGILTFIVVIIGLLSLRYSKKQIHFNTMTKCIDEYRRIVRDQQRLLYKDDKDSVYEKYILALDHLGLVNEELFYMQKNYLHKDISSEWINNMLDYIPVKHNGKCINESVIRNSKELHSLSNEQIQKYINVVKDFNKIDAIFTINKPYPIIENKYAEKDQLKMEILSNINNNRNIK
jgi:hypothetical protein